MVLGDDAAGDGQAQAGAAFLGGEVRQEEFVFVLGGNAVAAVGRRRFPRCRAAAGSAWRVRSCFAEEPSMASAALSIRLTITRRSSSASALTGGRSGGEVGADQTRRRAGRGTPPARRARLRWGRRGPGAPPGKRANLRKLVDQRFQGAHFAADQRGAFADQAAPVRACRRLRGLRSR